MDMDIAIFDGHPSKLVRYAKDTNGGYGTSTVIGGFLGFLLSKAAWLLSDTPVVYVGYLLKIFDDSGLACFYTRSRKKALRSKVIIVVSSIIAYEYDILCIKHFISRGKKVLVAGPFANYQKTAFEELGARIIPGEPEIFFNALSPDQVRTTLFNSKAEMPLVDIDQSKSLESLPMPAWEKVFKHYYLRALNIGFGLTLPISTSRGCPYSCRYYCTYPLQQGTIVRYRSALSVTSELKHWVEHYGIRNFQFRDPVFTLNRSHAKQICQSIIDSNLQINYIAELHLKDVDQELSALLSRSGCREVYVGIESVNPLSMSSANRFTIEIDKQKQAIELLRRSSISVKGMYIFGYESDTPQSILDTIEYACSNGCSSAQFNVYTPYPGTQAFADMRESISADRFDMYTQTRLVFLHQNISARRLQKLLSFAYFRFFASKVVGFFC